MSDDVRAEALDALQRYLQMFPEERGNLGLLGEQLRSPDDPFIRSNMVGHVTTSAIVLNPEGSKLLLVDHVILRTWLPPGGHYEGPGSLWASALREVAEETGVAAARPHAWGLAHGLPIDIDSHAIPANPRRAEGVHVHHDFQFLAVAPEDAELAAQLHEVHAVRWAPVEDLRDSPDERQRRVFPKLQRVGALARAVSA